jgi:hypothetical protein
MSKDPIRGKTLRFHFVDGAMANKTFEHRFADDGSVTFRIVTEANADTAHRDDSAGKAPAPKESIRYEVAPIRDDVCAVSYLSKGYTLTTILDFKSMKLVAFSSNEKMVSIQHGTFETSDMRGSETRANGAGAHPH